MYNAIKHYGTSLSHNQYPKGQEIANAYAIFIIKPWLTEHMGTYKTFINPVIIGYSKEKFAQYYTNLSDLGYLKVKAPYYKEILIAFYNKNLELKIEKYSDVDAAKIQEQFILLTTKGTYINILFDFCLKYEKDLNPSDKLKVPDYNDLPYIIPDYILSRCKKYLLEYEPYLEACNKHLKNNINDLALFGNLMSLTYYPEQERLYGECTDIIDSL